MEKKINLVELLKDCPKGMELDCLMYDNVTFVSALSKHTDYPIRIKTASGFETSLTQYGQNVKIEDAKCVIFPKGKTTWEGFHSPYSFKDGDILAYNSSIGTSIFIHRNTPNEHTYKTSLYVGVNSCGDLLIYNKYTLVALNGDSETRIATEEEKQKLFDAIKANGYKWNKENKTLEKLFEPKFKVGDRIKSVMSSSYYTVVDIKNDQYFIKSDTEKYPYQVHFSNEINYKLVPDKFDITNLKPFDKVLVRCSTLEKWRIQLFEKYDKTYQHPFICIGCNKYKQCIPYEGNEHLLGTSNDCDNYYKTWE